MTALRVLHVDGGRTFRGGQRQLLLLARGQRAVGSEPTVVTSSIALRAALAREEIRAAAPGFLPALLGEIRPHVVHAHDGRAHDWVHLLGPRATRVVHRRIDDPPSAGAWGRWKLGRGHFVCVSAAIAAVLEAAGVERARLDVVRSAVPSARPAIPGPRGLAAVGALVPHKGHGVLLDALPDVDGATLDLWGAGPLLGRLRQQAERLGLAARVRFRGDPRGEFPALDGVAAFVQPSLTEGLGTAVLDAAARSVPTVGSRCGGLPETIDDGRTGFLVPPGDPKALASALTTMLGLPEPRRLTMGEAARRRSREEFGIDTMVAQIDAIYHRLLLKDGG